MTTDEIIETTETAEVPAPEPVAEVPPPAPVAATRSGRGKAAEPPKPVIVRAKDSFATTGLRSIRKGQILPATDPIVLAKPHFFSPVES